MANSEVSAYIVQRSHERHAREERREPRRPEHHSLVERGRGPLGDHARGQWVKKRPHLDVLSGGGVSLASSEDSGWSWAATDAVYVSTRAVRRGRHARREAGRAADVRAAALSEPLRVRRPSRRGAPSSGRPYRPRPRSRLCISRGGGPLSWIPSPSAVSDSSTASVVCIANYELRVLPTKSFGRYHISF